MKTTFAYDKKANKPHYQVRHADIDEREFGEALAGPVVVLGQSGAVLKAVGRTLKGRFLTAVFIRRAGHDHVMTGWPAKRKQILLWHREMKKT